MDYSKALKIPFKGLTNGRHRYDWVIGKEFFDEFDNQDIDESNVLVGLELDVNERMFTLDFDIGGTITVFCDRCLESLILPLEVHYRYFIKIGNERMEESDDVLVIPGNEYRIDLYQLIYDYIVLSIPLKKIHADDAAGNPGCNQKALEILDRLSAKQVVDPRWEPLLNLKTNDNI